MTLKIRSFARAARRSFPESSYGCFGAEQTGSAPFFSARYRRPLREPARHAALRLAQRPFARSGVNEKIAREADKLSIAQGSGRIIAISVSWKLDGYHKSSVCLPRGYFVPQVCL